MAAQPAPDPRPEPTEAEWDRFAHVLCVALATAYRNGDRPEPTDLAARQRPAPAARAARGRSASQEIAQ